MSNYFLNLFQPNNRKIFWKMSYFIVLILASVFVMPLKGNASEGIVGKWARCDRHCDEDRLECWIDGNYEVEWFMASGKSIYIGGPKPVGSGKIKITKDKSALLSEYVNALKKIEHFDFSIVASISDYRVDDGKIIYSSEGNDEPWTALLDNVQEDQISYSYAEDNKIVSIDMCRVDSFSPLFEGISSYLMAKNTLDSSFKNFSINPPRISPVVTGTHTPNGTGFLSPLTLMSDDTAFIAIVDHSRSGTLGVSGQDTSIFSISPNVMIMVNLLNDSVTRRILDDSFR